MRFVQPEGIGEIDWIVADVRVEVDSAIEPSWVFAQEPAGAWIEVARPVEIQVRLGVEFATRETERIDERAAGSRLIAERIERVGLRQCARSVRERSNAAQTVGVVVAGRGAPQHGQRFVDFFCLRVAGNRRAAGVCLLNEIVSVVGVDASACGRRLVDSSSEGVVLERDSTARARQCHARQPILEAPDIRGRVRAGHAGERIAVVVVRVRRAGYRRQLIRRCWCTAKRPAN